MKIHARTQHSFLNRHTGLGVVLLMLFGFFFVSLVGQILELVLIAAIPAYGALAADGLPSVGFGVAAAGLLLLLVYRLWFRPEFRGTLGKAGLLRTAILSCGVLLYWIVGVVMLYVGGGKLHAISLQAVATSVMAGFGEEAMFRALPVSYLARQLRGNREKAPAIVWISAAFFALAHASNVILGADPLHTALQVAATFCIGVFFGAVYLRGGNLWPLIAAHTVNDLVAFASSDPTGITERGVVTAGATWADVLDLLPCALLAAMGLYFVRRAKRDAICAVWADRWQIPEEAQITQEKET